MKYSEFLEALDKLQLRAIDDMVMLVHPSIYTGYWELKWRPIKLFRRLGRLLNSRRIYWLEYPIVWINGLRYYYFREFGRYPDEGQALETTAGDQEGGKAGTSDSS